MHPHNVPSFPWQKSWYRSVRLSRRTVLANNRLLQRVPYHRKLTSTTSAVKDHLKLVFAENGIPETLRLVSDNRPQYTHCSSQEFAAFDKQSGIDHVTSSPLYPQSNGFIDNSPDSNESSRKSRSLGARPLSSTVDILFHTYRQQPTIACPTAEPQRLPHTVTNQ